MASEAFNYHITFPAPLVPGDKIAIVSPASAVKEEYVEGAIKKIVEKGYEVVLLPHVLNHASGSFSATKSERLLDLLDALEDESIKAIFCARGGYGCCQLLPHLPQKLISKNPKWIIGFSDISALLAAWYDAGVASIHGPMAKYLSTHPADDPCSESLFRILENGGGFSYKFPSAPGNRDGRVSGRLVGGNLAVLNDLSNTSYDMLEKEEEEVILFLEDISEPIYAVERMLMRLYLSSSLKRIKGFVFGQFTEYKPDRNHATMEEMLRQFVNMPALKDLPIAFEFPIGHAEINYPLVVGAKVDLEISSGNVIISTIDS